MRAILTVIGKDKVGIVAGVSAALAALKINIIDMNQTIMQGNFTMMMMLELPEESDFAQIREKFTEVESQLGVKISIQNEEIFEAMHKLG